MKTAVILAGGLGTRLRPLTDLVPKPLLPIGESTVLEIQISTLRQFGVERVFIATNYLSEYVEKVIGTGAQYGVQVTLSREPKRLGTAGPLSLLRADLDEPFLMMNGDILTNLAFDRFFGFVERIGADLTVVTTEINIPFRFGKVTSEGDFILAIEEKPDYKQEILAGIYAVHPRALDVIPDDTYFGIDDLIKRLLADRRPVAKYLMHDYWVDIGQLSDYEMAKELYEIRQAREDE